MPEHLREPISSAWKADLNRMIRNGPVTAIKSYSIFSHRSVPARASSQTWILAAATAGLLMLFPIFAAQIFFAYWNTGPGDIAVNWRNARPASVIGSSLTIPKHLSGYETRGAGEDRIVFGLSLEQILSNIDLDTGGLFDPEAMRQQITLTFFRPDQSVFGLSVFSSMYGGYLEAGRRVNSNGLTTRRFRQDGPFDNETFHYETGYNRDRYFVRCFDGAATGQLNTCFRKLKISNDLALRYTFDERLLENWIGLEAAIAALAARMIKGGERP